MKAAVHHLLSLHGPLAYALIFLLPALEASAFIGFVFPGEIAVILGGVMAFEHRVALGWVIVAAIAGAVIGDSIGYAVGSRWGRRLLETSLMRRLVPIERQENAAAVLRKHGGKAVFFGRFTAALRVLVPGFAGMAQVPYRRFVVYNVLGGAIWAAGFVLLGYAAGESYHTVERFAGAGALLLLVLFVVALSIGLGIRYARNHPERIAELGASVRRNRVLAPFARATVWVARFLRARFSTGSALGLSLTAALVVLGVSGTAFGVIVRNLFVQRGVDVVDRTVLTFMVAHTQPGITGLMRALTQLGGAPAIAIVLVVAAAGFRLRGRGWLPAIHLGVATAGGFVLVTVIKDLVARPRPDVARLVSETGFSFPSRHVTMAVIVYGTCALLLAHATRRWTAKVSLWGAAVAIAVAVAVSRLYLRVHFLTDVFGGAALGAAWLTLSAAAFRAFGPFARQRRPRNG